MRRTLSMGRGSRWLIVLGVFGLPNLANAEDERKLLALVKAGHQSAIESIHTLSCTVTVEADAPSFRRTTTGKYWRSMDFARIQQETPTGTADYFYLYKLSEIREVVRN